MEISSNDVNIRAIRLNPLAYEYDSNTKSIVLPKGYLYKAFYENVNSFLSNQ